MRFIYITIVDWGVRRNALAHPPRLILISEGKRVVRHRNCHGSDAMSEPEKQRRYLE